MYMKLLCIISIILFSYNAGAQNNATYLSEKDIPKSIKFDGTFKEAVQYKDKEGEHLVLTSEGGEQKGDDRTKFVYGYCYLKNGDHLALQWKLYDLSGTCAEDVEAQFLPKTLAVTDLNKDGVAEVWLMYLAACKGDVSPSNLKIIMHEGSKKYAVRGTTRVKVNATEYNGGDFSFDEAFKQSLKVFRDYAHALWQKNVNETHFD